MINHEYLPAVYQEGILKLNSFQQGYTSHLSLAISPLIADTILPFVLKRYTSTYPQVEISVKIVESAEIEHAVLSESADLGLFCMDSYHSEITSQILYRDRVILAAPHDGADSESALPLDPEELLTSNYLLTHNHPVYWDSLCRAVNMIFPGVRMMEVTQIHIP